MISDSRRKDGSIMLSYGGNLSAVRYDSVPQCKDGNQTCGKRCLPKDQECQVDKKRGGRSLAKKAAIGAGAAALGVAGATGAAAVRYKSDPNRIESDLFKAHRAVMKAHKVKDKITSKIDKKLTPYRKTSPAVKLLYKSKGRYNKMWEKINRPEDY